VHQQSFTLAELAKHTQSKLIGNPDHLITNVEDLENATSEDASFLSNPRYVQAMVKSKAGVVFVDPSITIPSNRNFLITESPSNAFQKTMEAFHGEKQEISGFTGIHPTVVIHPSSSIGQNVTIGPHTIIDKHVVIGEGTFINAGCYIGPNTSVGKECLFHSHVSIRERCVIGNRVILQPGVVIGSCGFGYLTDKQGRHTKLNQLGIVILEDDVEIGANTTIDRARFQKTIIKRGTKIDNLVQIGHGVVIGEDNIIVAQTGIAGSSKTGRNVVMGGQAAIAGHLHIADQVMLAARSGVSKSLTCRGKYGGLPAIPLNEYNRINVYLRNIAEYVNRIKALEKKVAELKNS
jgi:UDP-3-O-[3-hydroxymyristoyl] glucosamine N-acyltransferase